MKDLSQDFQELIGLLTYHDVEFIVVGAYALAFWGHTRYTEDIDLWIRRTKENAKNVTKALAEFGINLSDESAAQLTQDRKLLQFGIKPQRVDILTFLDGCDFDTAVERASVADIANSQVKFLSLEDYVLTKRASARRKDLRDLEDLREAIGHPLPHEID